MPGQAGIVRPGEDWVTQDGTLRGVCTNWILELELRKTLKFIIDTSECIFRTLSPEDVSEFYAHSLRKERELLEKVPEDITIKWQQNYIKKFLLSPCDTICGLFMDSELIGTSGIQNISVNGIATRCIKMAKGYTYDCTLGIFVLSEMLRGRGYGRTLVWASCYLVNNCFGVETFKASMKKNNIPSLKSFLACGFQVKEESIDGLNVELKIGDLLKPEFIDKIIIE